MARREEFYTVSDNNRDFNKTFVITEMSAFDAESFAIKLGLLLLSNNPELPSDLNQKIQGNELSMQDIAHYGFRLLQGLNYDAIKPVLDDLMMCVQIIVDKKSGIRRALVNEDIEEVKTIMTLRKKVVELHVNFLDTEDTQNTAI